VSLSTIYNMKICGSALLTYNGFARLQSCWMLISVEDCTRTDTKLY